jgi:hypothetical protein
VDTSSAGTAGAYTLNVQHIPVPGPADATLPAGPFSLATDTTGAPVRAFSCNATTGSERLYSFVTCPAYAGGALQADTCTATAFDTVLELQHGNAVGACDDNGAACGAGHSELMTSVPAGAGVHVLSVAGAAGSAGSVTISGTRP